MDASWIILIATLPGQAASLRLRFWRQLKAIGAASLRDGVYLLPLRPDLEQAMQFLRDELLAAGGDAYVLRQAIDSPALDAEWRQLFDRTDAYADWKSELAALSDALPETEGEARRQARQLRKGLDAIIAIDYFPGEARTLAEQAWRTTDARLTRHYSPDEPDAAQGEIARLDRADYQGRRWATRARPWVDRIACAWLIRRFIDPRAEFLWLSDARKCPRGALGFDFDGAAFTHVGDKVSFEVLMASFGLDDDPALARMAAMVHALDLGESAGPEAVGFEAVLTGARMRVADDDALLDEIGATLDSFYAYFQSQSR